MDRVEESVCCQEIKEVKWKNEEVAQVEQLEIPGCITDNPGFQAVSKSMGITGCVESVPSRIWQKSI